MVTYRAPLTWAPYRCDHDKALYKSTFTFTLQRLSGAIQKYNNKCNKTITTTITKCSSWVFEKSLSCFNEYDPISFGIISTQNTNGRRLIAPLGVNCDAVGKVTDRLIDNWTWSVWMSFIQPSLLLKTCNSAWGGKICGLKTAWSVS